jgi:hypothetical protein
LLAATQFANANSLMSAYPKRHIQTTVNPNRTPRGSLPEINQVF